jgi:hypothetical protein
MISPSDIASCKTKITTISRLNNEKKYNDQLKTMFTDSGCTNIPSCDQGINNSAFYASMTQAYQKIPRVFAQLRSQYESDPKRFTDKRKEAILEMCKSDMYDSRDNVDACLLGFNIFRTQSESEKQAISVAYNEKMNMQKTRANLKQCIVDLTPKN